MSLQTHSLELLDAEYLSSLVATLLNCVPSYKSFLLSVGCLLLTAIVPFVATKERNIAESFCLMSHHI